MKKFLISMFVFAVGLCACAAADVNMERTTYRGWVDSYRMTSGNYSLIVVPEIGGRVMEYAFNGRNIIWENGEEFGRTYSIEKEWHNYGGFKTWIAPQEVWGWPPDPYLEYGKANVEELTNAKGLPVLRVVGAPSLDAGLVIIKDITLLENGEVQIIQKVRNIGRKSVSLGVWDMTQVLAPCLVAFPVKQDSRFKGGISYIMAESKNSKQFTVSDGLCIANYLGEVGKIGADSDGPWMICFRGDLAYVKLFGAMDKDADYPDGGCSAEVFTCEPKLGCVRMELMGPIVDLKPGEQTEYKEAWRIFLLTQPVRDEVGVRKAVKGMKGKGWIP